MPRTTNPGHLAKNLSMQVFGAFAADLAKHLDDGLTDEQCNANKQWLLEVAAAASALPDSSVWGTKIYQRCDAVAKEYANWNSPEGTPEIRTKYHQRIKKKINKLSGAYRRRTEILQKKADLSVYLSFYRATEKMVLAFPNTLEAVANTLAKFPKTPPGTA